jgi:hypothetical protein
MEIVEILKLGFGGLAFLLAFLAFSLLSSEQKRNEPRPAQLKAISNYMTFSLLLGAMTVIGPFLPKFFEEKPNPLMEAMLEQQKNRKPMPLEFVQNQINELTKGHNMRIYALYAERNKLENKLSTSEDMSSATRSLERSMRRVEQNIREENMKFDSDVREFRSML